MTLGSVWRLVLLNIRRDKKSASFAAFGVAIGVGSLVFFVALGLGVSSVIREKVFPVETLLVEVVPPSVSLGSQWGAKLDQKMVSRLAAIKEVAEVYRKMTVRVPAISRYDGDFFGSQLRMRVEVLALGVDAALVRKDVRTGDFVDPSAAQPIPALVASHLLEIYNASFAPTRKLPRLSPTLVVGFTFPITFNASMVAPGVSGQLNEASVQVVGVSDRAMLAGITIPLDTAIRLNKAAGADSETFSSVVLRARDSDGVSRIVAEAKSMGFKIDDQEKRLAENAGVAVTLITSALALLSALICFLAGLNIANTLSAAVRSRFKEIGLMQAVGASRANIRTLVLAEAVVIGMVGGVAGTAVAVILARVVDALAVTYLPPFPFKPESFFTHPLSVLLGGVGLGLFAALAGAYFPSRSAASVNPARALAE
jgi:ABC-type antimicrobial peptide transport system permease subunit